MHSDLQRKPDDQGLEIPRVFQAFHRNAHHMDAREFENDGTEGGDAQWNDEVNKFKNTFSESPPSSGREQKKLATIEMGDEVLAWSRDICPPTNEYSDA